MVPGLSANRKSSKEPFVPTTAYQSKGSQRGFQGELKSPLEFTTANPRISSIYAAGLERAEITSFPLPSDDDGDWKEASRLMEEAMRLVPNKPLFISLQGLLHALMGNQDAAIECVARACSNPKSFGHSHHTYYQIACTLARIGRRETAFEWLERSVSTGFACWPYFLKDSSLASLRSLPEFELLISALQAKYPDHLGLL